MRRLRATGLPAGLVVFFFAPYVNLLFFIILCIYPSRRADNLPRSLRIGANPVLNLRRSFRKTTGAAPPWRF
jgi:hypothetical protein